ncbi:hypothetical protein [Nesterenkonia pannonica]|uniref:hypothetical protein n=1 Tax=Nesterenkonia pannonica TaxID=1548602 RepID=UPI0021643AE4|nr:hypothetical protein [Nesterenkonia pannonica]
MRRRATSLWRQQGRLTQERDQVTADARKLWDENHFLRQEAQRLGVMDDLSRGEHRNALEKEIARVETELKARRDEGERKVAQVEAELRSGREAGEAQQQNYAELVRKEQARLEQVREDIVDLRDMADLNDYGLYNFENPADDSVRYKDELQTRQAEIRKWSGRRPPRQAVRL